MLADGASIERSGKVYVLGGGWNRIFTRTVPTVYPQITVVLIFQFEPPDVTGEEFAVKVELITPDGSLAPQGATGTLGVLPEARQPGDLLSAPVVLPFFAVELKQFGTHHFRVLLEGEELAGIPFNVVPRAAEDAPDS